MEKQNKESIINVITKVIILRLIIVIIVEIRKIVIVIVLAIHVNVNVKFKFTNIVALETLFLRGSVIPQPSPSPSSPSSSALPSLPVTSCQYYHRLPLLGFFRPVHANADSADTENTSGIEVDNHNDESIWKKLQFSPGYLSRYWSLIFSPLKFAFVKGVEVDGFVDHFRCTPWYSASSPFFFHLFHLHCFLFNPPLLPQTFSYFFSAPLFLPLVAVVRYHRHYHSLSRLNYQIIMNCFVIQGCNMKYRISNQLFHSYDMKVLGRSWPHNAVCDQRGTTSVQKS